MLLHITDTINHDQAVCHHTEVEEILLTWFVEPTNEVKAVITDVANAAAAPQWAPDYVALCDWLGIEIDHLAPDEEPIPYVLASEYMPIDYTLA